MRPPIFVRALSEAERERLEAGLRSTDVYELRRCQVLLASAREERVPRIAATLGCDEQTVRNVTFGKPTGVWTMELAAEVSVAEGITPERVTGETIRQAILRLGVRWRRAKQWITSPDPAYARKKVRATA
jgi:hypothetical protein